jgi:predicted membrane-bound mannosyltransferase
MSPSSPRKEGLLGSDPGEESGAKRGRRGIAASRIGLWLGGRVDLFALVVVAAGFALRIAAARGTHLSGDEAVNFQMANQSRLGDVYRSTLNNANPPLFYLLLRAWRLLGNSELFLRLLPVTFGTLLLWVAYRWASSLYGRFAGLVTLMLLAFSPATVALSADLRSYTLLVLLIAASAVAFERALAARAAGWMAISSALLCLAVLTHYSAIFFAAALVRLCPGPFHRKPAGAFSGSRSQDMGGFPARVRRGSLFSRRHPYRSSSRERDGARGEDPHAAG